MIGRDHPKDYQLRVMGLGRPFDRSHRALAPNIIDRHPGITPDPHPIPPVREAQNDRMHSDLKERKIGVLHCPSGSQQTNQG
jgi:hypothetical protein